MGILERKILVAKIEAEDALRRERKLQWQLAEATCLVYLLMLECSHSVGPGVIMYDLSDELCDRAASVFKDYP